MNRDILDYIKNPVDTGISDQVRLTNLYHMVRGVVERGLEGDFIEFGCFTGTSAVLIQKTLIQMEQPGRFSVYDSFEGLTDLSDYDRIIKNFTTGRGHDVKKGDFYRPRNAYQTDEDSFLAAFDSNNTPRPVIVKGRFQETLPEKLPETIAFAHIDCDLYEPIKHCLTHVIKKMSPGGIILVDDYDSNGGIFPGCKKAVQEFSAEYGLAIEDWRLDFLQPYAMQAVIRANRRQIASEHSH